LDRGDKDCRWKLEVEDHLVGDKNPTRR
jgi:hypothetical protein